MDRIDAFLGGSLLPFVGRKEEIARLLAFWRGTEENDHLRTTLLVGEAGIGKSRLIHELIPEIERRGGLVIHARIYPGAMTSMAPIIARAIWSSRTARDLLRRMPEGTLGSVVETLIRLTRLRPTLLIVEDTDLLGEEALRELVQLTDALAAEPMALLNLSRPVEHPARRALERYRVDEIELGGLSRSVQADLWKELFESSGDPAVIDALSSISHGNPLALRSALRGALRAGVLRLRPDHHGVELASSQGTLETILRQSIESVPIGLTVHLSLEERDAAERLAMLGEIFAVEAAEALLDGDLPILERIREKGIIAVSEWWPSSLPDAESTHPLFVFTHSLLHAHLLRAGRAEYRKLIEILGAGLPLYSIVPIQLLQSARTLPLDELPLTLIDATTARLSSIARKLNEGADWENALWVWSVGEMLFRQSASRWEPDDRRRILSSLYDVRLYFFQRGAYSEEYESWADRFLALTATVDSPDEARQRLSAMLHRQDLEFRKNRSGSLESFREVDLLIRRFPALQHDPIFSDYLQQMARISWVLNSAELARQVEQYVEQITATMTGSPESVTKIRRKVSIYLLTWFDTPEELERRLGMLADLEASDGQENLDVAMQKIELYFRIGRLSDIRDAFADVITRCHRNGLFRFESRYRFQQAVTRFALEGSIAELEHSIEQIFIDAPVALSREFRWYTTNGMAHFALLHDELTWGRNIVERFSDLTGTLLYKSRILAPLATNDLEALARLEGLNRADAIARDAAPLAQRMVAILLGEEGDAGLFQDLKELIAEPLLTVGRAVDLRLIVELADRVRIARPDQELARMAASIVRAGLAVLLPWLAERSYLPALRATVGHFGSFLDPHEREMWDAKIAGLQDRQVTERTSENARVHISMLGTILVNRPGEAPHRLRGSRLSILLGLMVADRMLGKSLAPNEFRRLAFQVNDPEYGRKMVNGAVWRLREIIGHDAIRTDGDTPHLDLDRVEIDLLEANALLERARDAVRSGALIRAVPPLLAALRISRGEVPFPGLYEDFFEAARDDFETKLRRTVIDVATTLLQEEDAARAEEVLRRASETIPGDEDFGALLHQALITLGRRAEAEVLKADRK